MGKKCYHCGEPLTDKDDVCPRCGADTHESRKPKTIYELRTFCAQKNMPLEQMRFFIGEDFREPKAFGIYQDDDGQFVVYKNKADGSRAIRYRGPDEAHAVNEIYLKLKSEIELRRAKKTGVTRGGAKRKKRTFAGIEIGAVIAIIAVVVGIMAAAFFSVRSTPRRGYYHYGGDTYYYYNDWYRYDEDEWAPVYDVDEELQKEFRDYRADDYDVPAFEDSDWYTYEQNRDSDDDDDDDWNDDDWDDWDTGDTDWDSDW